MASVEIAPLSKHMTPNIFSTITSAKKIMIMHLIVAKYYYSSKVGEFLFYLTKPKFELLKMAPLPPPHTHTLQVAPRAPALHAKP